MPEHAKMSDYFSYFVDFLTHECLKLSVWFFPPISLSRCSFVIMGLSVKVICMLAQFSYAPL